jgi:hypothetical protein
MTGEFWTRESEFSFFKAISLYIFSFWKYQDVFCYAELLIKIFLLSPVFDFSALRDHLNNQIG